MFDFDIHNKDTASKEGAKSIDKVLKKFGFVPNIIGVMAEAPATATSYLALADLVETTSFSDTEIQTVLMTINRFHECTYCMAAHSVIAEMKNVPESVINAIRDDRPIQDNKLETLRQTVYSLVENRGHLSKGTLGKFASAGYTRKNLLELLPLIAMKTLSNYTNHLANTPLDDAFSQKEWSIPHTAQKMSA